MVFALEDFTDGEKYSTNKVLRGIVRDIVHDSGQRCIPKILTGPDIELLVVTRDGQHLSLCSRYYHSCRSNLPKV